MEAVLDTLLTYTLIENSPDDDFEVDVLSSDEEQDCIAYETKEASDLSTKKKSIVSQLVDMGYTADFASAAIDRCGIDTPIIDLIDMMAGAAMVYDSETSIGENLRGKEPAHETKERCYTSKQKRKLQEVKDMTIKKHRNVSDKGRSLEKHQRIMGKPTINLGVRRTPPPHQQSHA